MDLFLCEKKNQNSKFGFGVDSLPLPSSFFRCCCLPPPLGLPFPSPCGCWCLARSFWVVLLFLRLLGLVCMYNINREAGAVRPHPAAPTGRNTLKNLFADNLGILVAHSLTQRCLLSRVASLRSNSNRVTMTTKRLSCCMSPEPHRGKQRFLRHDHPLWLDARVATREKAEADNLILDEMMKERHYGFKG